MKKHQLAAIIVGAVLITGSTVSISAASMSKGHHKSHSAKSSASASYLKGVKEANSWAALHSVLNRSGKVEASLPPILPPSGILPSDTSTATMALGDDGNNEVGDSNDDDAPGVVAAPVVPAPTPTPNSPTGIVNPMTKHHGDSNEQSGQSQEGSNEGSNQSQGDSND
ncbi:MAG TPA: hypothetical protein VF307_03395 [Candidatus Nanopelagicaceae bacterium]